MTHSRKLLRATSIISTIATGLFSGLMCGYLMAIDPTLDELNGLSFANVMHRFIQPVNNSLLVPLMMVAPVLSPLVSLFLLWRHKGSLAFKYTLLGFGLFVVVFFMTMVLRESVNTFISSWNVRPLPGAWTQNRDYWHQLNLLRTPASVLAFVAHILAFVELGKNYFDREGVNLG